MPNEIDMITAKTRAFEYLQDNPHITDTVVKQSQERRTFNLPKSIWVTMFLCYAIFFTAITVATGRDGGALFMIVISVGYTVMYFGTAAVLNSVGADARPAVIPGDIDTATGKLSYGDAFAQILTVPIVIAVFGCMIAAIRAIVIP